MKIYRKTENSEKISLSFSHKNSKILRLVVRKIKKLSIFSEIQTKYSRVSYNGLPYTGLLPIPDISRGPGLELCKIHRVDSPYTGHILRSHWVII
jgi:hypothetical protein